MNCFRETWYLIASSLNVAAADADRSYRGAEVEDILECSPNRQPAKPLDQEPSLGGKPSGNEDMYLSQLLERSAYRSLGTAGESLCLEL